MKKFLAVLLFASFVAPIFADDAAPAAAAPAAAAPAVAAPAAAAPKIKKVKPVGDEAGIKKAFSEVSDAWAAGDAAAVAAHFLKDGSFINPFGQDAWDRDAIEKIAASDLQMMKGSTQTFSDFKFRFILPGFALVDLTATLSGLKNADGSGAPDTQFHIYAAVAQRGAKWFAVALRPYAFVKMDNTAPAAAPAAPAAAAPAAPAPAAAVPAPAAPPALPAAK
jgi:2-oxoglutarate dehydrogenase E2 component (dihydrolipoamide succinyltransferase)